MTANSKLNALIDAFLGGDASDAELDELSRLIAEDPGLARLIYERAEEDEELRTLFSEPASACAPVESSVTAGTKFWARMILPLAASLVAAAGVWIYVARQPSEIGRVVDFRGECLMQNGKCRIGAPVLSGAKIETGTNGWVKVAYLDEATVVEEFESSELACFLSKTAGKKVELQKGRISAVVAGQKKDKRFVVVTPHARVTAKGTRFDVREKEDGVWVRVEEGVVELKNTADGRALDVKAGESAAAGRDFNSGVVSNGTGFIDGPVIFEDNFNSGLAGWQVEVFKHNADDPSIRRRPFEKVHPDCARVEAARTDDGKQAGTLVLDARPLGSGEYVNCLLKTAALSHSFVVQFDTMIQEQELESSWASLWVVPSTGSEEVKVSRDPERLLGDDSIPAGKWFRYRAEYVGGSTEAGQDTYELTAFLDGKLIRKYRVYSSGRLVDFAVAKNVLRIKNVQVRKLIPAAWPVQ